MKSTVTVELENATPLGERPPEYMISLAKEGSTGPINTVLAQFHLPNGAEVQDVRLDRASVGGLQFVEKWRPSVVVGVTLPPREVVRVKVEFLEPKIDKSGSVTVQPLASPQATRIVDIACVQNNG